MDLRNNLNSDVLQGCRNMPIMQIAWWIVEECKAIREKVIIEMYSLCSRAELCNLAPIE